MACKYFSCSEGWLFHIVMAPLVVQKIFSLLNSYLLSFTFDAFAFDVKIQKFLLSVTYWHLPNLFLGDLWLQVL